MLTLQGIIERITFRSLETGYTVAKLQLDGSLGKQVTVVGKTVSLSQGEKISIEGEWTTHAQFGRQFKISSYQTVYPSTIDGIRKYLGSGLIKGIGPVNASRIVDCFGASTLKVIEKFPHRLREVEGLGAKRVDLIVQTWEEQREIHRVMLFLQSHDVGMGYAVKIWRFYGQKAIALIQENPYRLATDIRGIGFLTADRIAQKLGVELHSKIRILAGIRHVLNTAAEENGHVYLPREELVSNCIEFLDILPDMVGLCLDDLRRNKEVIFEEDRVYIPHLYYSEKGTATRLYQLSSIHRIEAGNILNEIEVIEQQEKVAFAPLQRVALEKALTHNLLILTGGPGTGKTTTIKGLIALLEARKKRIALSAPTGRAAKRMSEATGRQAKTIHRLLGFSPGEMAFEKNFSNLLEIDALIVDEVSMVDIVLINSLLRAVPISASVVLVGDMDQLPSVGPGNVLRDIIGSGNVETVALNEIFRQARASRIVLNAHAINEGKVPDIPNTRDSDFFFIEREDPEQVVEMICELCKSRLPHTYQFDPIDDIQVLTPMYRGQTGATNLNLALQNTLNPGGQELQWGGEKFRVGDKVMQVRNNYDKDIFNGDVGRIFGIAMVEKVIRVKFQARIVDYDFSELDEIVLAYATSIHKSQGSEYPAVIFPLTTQHFIMLQRNLLYTAITRARNFVVIIGTNKALEIAVKNNQVADRYSSLPERIKSGIADIVPTKEAFV